jgi:hypothetical protein
VKEEGREKRCNPAPRLQLGRLWFLRPLVVGRDAAQATIVGEPCVNGGSDFGTTRPGGRSLTIVGLSGGRTKDFRIRHNRLQVSWGGVPSIKAATTPVVVLIETPRAAGLLGFLRNRCSADGPANSALTFCSSDAKTPLVSSNFLPTSG